jgi:hypothetical protein
MPSTELIRSGELQVEGRFVDASNATLYALVIDGERKCPVIYKPIAGERPLWDFPDGNLAERELAAFLLSEKLGLHLVPFTVLRDGPFGPGMVQEWIEIDASIDVVALAQSQNAEIRTMALFDAVINNTDRKYGHILPTASGEIFGCDHGVTFHQDPKLRTVLWQFASADFTIEESSILRHALKVGAETLSGVISGKEIEAMNSRILELIKVGTFPEPSDEWPAVPWPPF